MQFKNSINKIMTSNNIHSKFKIKDNKFKNIVKEMNKFKIH